MDLNVATQKLLGVFNRLAGIPGDEWRAFQQTLTIRNLTSNDYLFHSGDISQHYFFMVSGLVRLFYTTHDGKEFNKSFLIENDIVGSLNSVLTGAPSRFAAQALEGSSMVVISHAILQQFYDRHACWERIGRRMAELLAVKKERREAAFLLDSAEQRYKQFLHDHPGLDKRIAQYHIASYLGITDVALSRIRRQLRSALT